MNILLNALWKRVKTLGRPSALKKCMLIGALVFLPMAGQSEELLTEGGLKKSLRKFVRGERHDDLGLQEHYRLMMRAYENKNWSKALGHAAPLVRYGKHLPFAGEVAFIKGMSHYQLRQFEDANLAFCDYLEISQMPHHLETVMQKKLEIAAFYAQGNGKHVFDLPFLPRIMNANEEAEALFDEVVASLPRHRFAVEALFKKANLEKKRGHYREAVDLYETLIRRFPKHDLALQSYIEIADSYLKHTEDYYPDPHYMELARVSAQNFRMDFPNSDKLVYVDECIQKMEELFAESFLELAKFFEVKKRQDSSAIYYQTIVTLYPGTKSAVVAAEMLKTIPSTLLPENSKPSFETPSILVDTLAASDDS